MPVSSLPTVTLRGILADGQGQSPGRGKAYAYPVDGTTGKPVKLLDEAEHVLMNGDEPVVDATFTNGAWSLEVLPTDTAGVTPTGWALRVVVKNTSGTKVVDKVVLVPASAATDGAVWLDDLADLTSTTPLESGIVWGPISEAGVSSWDDLQDKPATFPPSSHTHPTVEVTGLATVATSGSYADLSNKPTIPDSADDIGAASSSALASEATARATGDTNAIATAATDATAKANAAQAYAIQRANHTGTQTSATIIDLPEAVQDIVAATLVGSGVAVTYDDNAGTVTITGAASTDLEAVRDAIGVALVGVGNIGVAVDDAANTITISTTATVNSTDAALRDRSTHTGTQAISTVSGLQTALDGLGGQVTSAAIHTARPDLDAAALSAAYARQGAQGRTDLGLGTAAQVNTGTAPGDVPLLGTGGRLAIARIASGTPDGTKFVRDDGTLATPAGGGGSVSALTRIARTAAYTAALWDLVAADTTSGTFAVTLPAASGGKGRIAVKWVAGTAAPTIALTGTDHLNTSTGPTTGSFTVANQALVFESDGAGIWTVTADDAPLSQLDLRYGNLTVQRGNGQYVRSGEHVGFAGNVSTGFGSVVAYRPFRIAKGGTVTSVSVRVASAVAASTVRPGLFAHDPATGLPTTRIADWGLIDTSTTGIKTVTISQALADDTIYWLGISIVNANMACTNEADPLLRRSSAVNSIVAGLTDWNGPALPTTPDIRSGSTLLTVMPNIVLGA